MKLTSEEIKRLVFEADEKNNPADETEGDIVDDPEETPTDADKKQAKKADSADSADNQSDDSQGEKNPAENGDDDLTEAFTEAIKTELSADGWKEFNYNNIKYFFKSSEDSKIKYILNFPKLFNESKFLAKIRELILEEDTTNTTCILELINTDTCIAYGPFTLGVGNNYDELKTAIAEKTKEVVDSKWSEEFADKEFAKVSELTKELVNDCKKQKAGDAAAGKNEDKPAEKEDQSTDGEKHSEKYIVDKINEIFSKLTEDEQNAFEAIYGEKLINKIQGK